MTPNIISPNGSLNTVFKSFEHATKFYTNNYHSRAPKVGFLYFVQFNFNQDAVLDPSWDSKSIGLFAKQADMPKFKIATDVINQYNRKTNIQTKLTYEPVNIELHDDNGDTTNKFWKNYYQFYYNDSRYTADSVKQSYADTKFGSTSYHYGYDAKTSKFIDSIDLYIMHQGQYTKMTLINPIISSWDHDTLSQSEGNKVLRNKMSVVYETVLYDSGSFTANPDAANFASVYNDYDVTPSPNQVGDIFAYKQDYAITTAAAKQWQTTNFNGLKQGENYVKPPSQGQLTKVALQVSSAYRALNQINQLINQPRAAWNVYGINIHNEVISAVAGTVNAAAVSLTNTAAFTPPKLPTN
jgi:hypothetical protein